MLLQQCCKHGYKNPQNYYYTILRQREEKGKWLKTHHTHSNVTSMEVHLLLPSTAGQTVSHFYASCGYKNCVSVPKASSEPVWGSGF